MVYALWAPTAVLIGAAEKTPDPVGSGLCTKVDTEVEAFARRIYPSGLPVAGAKKKFSAEKARGCAVRKLLSMLEQGRAARQQQVYLSNVVLLLGVLGPEKEVYDPLREFLEEAPEPESAKSAGYYRAKISVPLAYGYVIRTQSGDRGWKYLKSGLKPEKWGRVRWDGRSFHRDRSAWRLELTKMSILGLGIAGTAEAAEILDQLDRTAQEPEIKEMITRVFEDYLDRPSLRQPDRNQQARAR